MLRQLSLGEKMAKGVEMERVALGEERERGGRSGVAKVWNT